MNRKLLRGIVLPLVCLGLVQCSPSTTDTSSAATAFASVRLDPTTGVADSTFGGTGIVVTDISSTLFDFAMALAVQPDNKLVVGGSNGLASQGQVALVRYNEANGALDTTFGTS